MLFMRLNYTDLVEGLSTTEDEVLGTDNESILEEVAAAVVVQRVLVPVEGASVEGVEVARGSKRHCLLLHPAIRWRRRVLRTTMSLMV